MNISHLPAPAAVNTPTRVIALIPAYNEATTIAATVEAVRAIPEVTGVLVIDDGSKDATAQLAQKAGAELVRCPRNRGKGAALQRGVDHLSERGGQGVGSVSRGERGGQGDGSSVHFSGSLPTNSEQTEKWTEEPSPCPLSPPPPADIVLLLDGDLGASASEAQALLYPVLDGLADMTIGVLPKPPGSGGFGVVKDLARSAIRDWGGGYDAQAPLSGQRALSWECLQAVLPFAQGYGVEVALSIRALQADLRLLEVRVDMQHRATGRNLSGFIHRGRQYIDVYRTIQRLERLERETGVGSVSRGGQGDGSSVHFSPFSEPAAKLHEKWTEEPSPCPPAERQEEGVELYVPLTPGTARPPQSKKPRKPKDKNRRA